MSETVSCPPCGGMQVAEHCSALVSLDVGHTDVGDIGVLAVCEKLGGTLRRLSLAGCHRLTSASIV